MIENYASFMKKHLGYTDEEMKVWLDNPRNKEGVLKVTALLQKTIVIKVVESHGCNSLHKIGQEFYFDGPGNLLSNINPKRICIYALSQMERLIFAAQELFYAGIDPNNMRIKHGGCFDIGLKCGGWGRIIFELEFKDRKIVRKELAKINEKKI
jgi:uncharacterized repeat protein (TIGR04076 family)